MEILGRQTTLDFKNILTQIFFTKSKFRPTSAKAEKVEFFWYTLLYSVYECVLVRSADVIRYLRGKAEDLHAVGSGFFWTVSFFCHKS